MKKEKNAFTLVELLSVIVILGITFMFVIPSLTELYTMGNKTETELIEEKVLSAAKEYVNKIDGTFYTKLYKEGDTNYIYKSDLINAGLITNEEISKLNTFAGVKGEVLKNDRIRYTVEYINASNNEYTNEELYLMIKNNSSKIDNIDNEYNDTKISLLDVYPIGSIYISENSTSPSKLFGGSWESYGVGRTIVGVDTSQTEFATAGKIGGEKAHILTIDEMASHSHTRGTMNITGNFKYNDDSNNAGIDATPIGEGAFSVISGTGYASGVDASSGAWNITKGFNFNAANSWTGSTSLVGNSQAHNNLQPYITVYMWKRTA